MQFLQILHFVYVCIMLSLYVCNFQIFRWAAKRQLVSEHGAKPSGTHRQQIAKVCASVESKSGAWGLTTTNRPQRPKWRRKGKERTWLQRFAAYAALEKKPNKKWSDHPTVQKKAPRNQTDGTKWGLRYDFVMQEVDESGNPACPDLRLGNVELAAGHSLGYV